MSVALGDSHAVLGIHRTASQVLEVAASILLCRGHWGLKKRWQFCNGSSPLWQAQSLKNQLVHRAHRVLSLLQLAISGNRLPQIPQRCKFHGVSTGFQLHPSLPSKHKPPFPLPFQTINLNYLDHRCRPGIVISWPDLESKWVKLAKCKMDRLGTTYTGCEVQHYLTILSILTQQEKPKVYFLEELFQISKVGVYLKIF